ncbi:hypothetical protein [Nannocystis bainbridge]|uniref:Knr4/Smi1-like domain-containing protein n=1 Tax=Nannocystis bainbridge TaxID=2995303 RepID=A0ABT5E740_9BACT|nr:hypothetical protein [Nannocystis bainbridge]MDC0721243.1 hypothetical protein [Nannocystis bainbridge]
MTHPPDDVFARVSQLLGKRSDDPAVVAFHAARGLKPPPIVTKLDMLYDVRDQEAGFTLNYQAEVLLPGCYPPRREGGKYVAYLASVDFRPSFTGRIAGELDVGLPEAQARTLAQQFEDGSWSTPMYRGHVVRREAGQEVVFLYDPDDDSFAEVQLQLVQLAEDDPALAQLASDAKASEPTPAPRQFPRRGRKAPGNEPLPAPLAALFELQGSDGLGEIDLEVLSEIEAGGPAAWTGNKAAEHELRVFAQDGSGGLVAFWIVQHDDGAARPLADQPVVFLGSEGERGAVASDLADFLHLLAAGIGPYEVVEYGSTEGESPQPAIAALAEQFFPARGQREASAIIVDAQRDYADFADRLAALVKH